LSTETGLPVTISQLAINTLSLGNFQRIFTALWQSPYVTDLKYWADSHETGTSYCGSCNDVLWENGLPTDKLNWLISYIPGSNPPNAFASASPTPSPSPSPSPSPTPSPSPPPQAVTAGFSSLLFDEEFQGPLDVGFGTTGHKWNAGLWWEPVPPTSSFAVKDGVLTITGNSSTPVELCTQYHDFSGGTYFQGGYFEARVFCTDWSAFWLYSQERPTVFGNLVLPADPTTWTNEIDIVETDPGHPNTVYSTIHKNSSGDGGVPDAQNIPDFATISPGPVEGAWHIYGCLWTRDQINFYVDNVLTLTTTPFASSFNPVQLVLTAQPRGVAGGASNVLPPITQVDWVRVWNTQATPTPTPATPTPTPDVIPVPSSPTPSPSASPSATATPSSTPDVSPSPSSSRHHHHRWWQWWERDDD
jgi:beta-glucanase (GH16 family)